MITQLVPQVGAGLLQTLLGQLLAIVGQRTGAVGMQQPLIGRLVLGGVNHGSRDRSERCQGDVNLSRMRRSRHEAAECADDAVLEVEANFD